MPHDVLDYGQPSKRSLPLRALGRLLLSLPPAWLIIASFLAFYDVPRGDAAWPVVLLTFYVFWGSLVTLIGSVCEWLSEDGSCGPLLLHVAAAIVVLIAISHLSSR